VKVLFQSRSTLFSVPGGDTVQLLKTEEFLRGLGIAVEISTELEPALEGYDLVHLFNLMRPQEVYLQAANAKRQGRPVVLSTIYGLYTEYERKARTGMAGFVARHASPWQVERLKVVARAFTNREVNRGTLLVAGIGYEQLCRKVTELCDVFLPNSPDEMRRVNADFPGTIGKPFVVVPNAVDVAVFDPMRVRIGDSARKFAGCVLSVARIEGRKCQLELVRAVSGLPVKLVLIGSPAPNHAAYFETMRAVAGNNVHILGQVRTPSSLSTTRLPRCMRSSAGWKLLGCLLLRRAQWAATWWSQKRAIRGPILVTRPSTVIRSRLIRYGVPCRLHWPRHRIASCRIAFAVISLGIRLPK